jgi:hypothetical protein
VSLLQKHLWLLLGEQTADRSPDTAAQVTEVHTLSEPQALKVKAVILMQSLRWISALSGTSCKTRVAFF